MRKILDIRTITLEIRDDNTFLFDQGCMKAIKDGYEHYGRLHVTYTPTVDMKGATPGYGSLGGGQKSLTQQFLKYEE